MNKYRRRCVEANKSLLMAKAQYAEWKIPEDVLLFKQTDRIGRTRVVLLDSNYRKRFVKQEPLKSIGVNIQDLPDYDLHRARVGPLFKKVREAERSARWDAKTVIENSVGSSLYMFYKERREAYEDYLSSEEWQQKREACFSIWGRVCVDCRISDASDIHHKHYDTLGDENPEFDLVPLCRICHTARHDSGILAQKAEA